MKTGFFLLTFPAIGAMMTRGMCKSSEVTSPPGLVLGRFALAHTNSPGG